MAAQSLPKAVLYLRMSSEHQDQSIPSQRSELTNYANRQPYNIVGEYIDEAISGDDTANRTDFLRMRADASSGNFDLVLCWDQDRFGRFDILDAGHWITPFRQAGVRLETIAQGKIDWEDLVGQLIYSVNQMGKAQFLRDLARNTTRGLLASAKEGRAGTGGPNPYGYRSSAGTVEIVLEEAEVVRWIFDEYLKPGASIRSIAAELNRRGIPPARSKVWRMSSVRSILERRKYTGTFVYGARRAGKYFCWRDGEVVPRRRNDKTVKSDPIVIENKFEAIIDQETFDKVQAKLESRKGKTSPKQYRQYLLAGLIRCGDCGGAMGGVKASQDSSYRCRQYHQTGSTTCFCNTIKEAPLVNCIVRKIQENYLSDAALTRLRRALEEEQKSGRPKPQDLSGLRRQVERLDRKIDQGADRVLDAPQEIVPVLYRKIEQLKSERDGLASRLRELTSRPTRSAADDKAEIERAIAALRNLGEELSRANPTDTKELLSSIVTKVELHFKEGTGRKKRDFTHGTIYLRPDAGGGFGESRPPEVTHLTTIRTFWESSAQWLVAR